MAALILGYGLRVNNENLFDDYIFLTNSVIYFLWC